MKTRIVAIGFIAALVSTSVAYSCTAFLATHGDVVVFDLAEELKKGKRILDLPSLFPPTDFFYLTFGTLVKLTFTENEEGHVTGFEADINGQKFKAGTIP